MEEMEREFSRRFGDQQWYEQQAGGSQSALLILKKWKLGDVYDSASPVDLGLKKISPACSDNVFV